MKGRRILVTGGSGFIGSHLVKKLIKLGAKLYVLTRHRYLVNNIRLKNVWKKINILNADLRNIDSLNILRGIEPEIIFHLAAYHHVGNSFTHFSEAIETNCLGTINLIESVENYERFIYTSTSEVYGFQATVPFRENMTPQPISPYAVGKYAGELYCMMKCHMGYPVTVLRPFNIYGPFQSKGAIIPEVILDCLQGRAIKATQGKQTREFNYIDDIIRGFIIAAKTKKAIGEIINLGCGKEISIRNLILKIIELTNSESKVIFGALLDRPTEIWRMCADNTKARDILGWFPKISIENGLKRTIDWYRRNKTLF